MSSGGSKEYDAVVVGAGPNGFAAAITLRQAGLSVLLLEAKDTVGGGLRSQEITLPGFVHDICSAIHPLAAGSPFFKTLPLASHGLEFIQPTLCAAHPFDDGNAAILDQSIDNTARLLDADEKTYLNLMTPLVNNWPSILDNILGPVHVPKNPVSLARFGIRAIQPANIISRFFSTKTARGMWAGMSAHSMMPLSAYATAATGLVLLAAGHHQGWPIPKGGSRSIADALLSYFTSIGGKVETGKEVRSLQDLPRSRAILFDVSPRQLIEIGGDQFSSLYKWQLARYRYGMGVFKIDWALDGPVPFKSDECRLAGTVHIGNTFEEIAHSEHLAWNGKHADKPFVLLAQQSLFDHSRAPEGKHTVWAYCHVPHGSTQDMTKQIEQQVERFAPGFRDRILARHVMNTQAIQSYNPNYIGGDINGGAFTLTQIFTRPVLRLSPYRTSAKGIYICSSSTPPGGGVHGMCGYHAARQVLKDVF